MNFEKIFNEMLDAMKMEIGKDWSKVKIYIKQIMENNKAAIKEITEYYLNGELTKTEYKEELKDNMITLENEMLNLKIMKKKAIEKAINAGIEVLMKVIKLV